MDRSYRPDTPTTPPPTLPPSLPTPSLPPILATDRHFFSHRCQASSDREIHPSSSSPQILSHLSPSYQTLTRHEPLLVIAFLSPHLNEKYQFLWLIQHKWVVYITQSFENNLQVRSFKKWPSTFIHELICTRDSSVGWENTSLASSFGEPKMAKNLRD